MEENMIKIENASISFKKFYMEPVNLNIPQGYIVGVQGENGAGKSTLLKMILGQYSDMKGDIYVDGENVREKRESVLQKIGYVDGNRVFFEEKDALGNEKYFAPFYEEWDKDEYRKMLRKMGVKDSLPIKKLSKGERVKFQLAFAAAYQPKVLLLDEPTAGLDPVFRDDFLKMLQSFVADYETTILLATHLDEDMNKIADYVIDIEHGVCSIREVGEM